MQIESREELKNNSKDRKKFTVHSTAAIVLLLLITSCASRQPAPERRPFTEKESNVNFVGSEQETTIRLKEECRPIGKLETLTSEYDIVIRTAAIDANVAQVLSHSRSVRSNMPYGIIVNPKAGKHSYDVRFWKCPKILDNK